MLGLESLGGLGWGCPFACKSSSRVTQGRIRETVLRDHPWGPQGPGNSPEGSPLGSPRVSCGPRRGKGLNLGCDSGKMFHHEFIVRKLMCDAHETCERM